jgi:hypothetical protein
MTQGTMLPSVPREQLRSIVERDTLEALGLRKPGETAKALPGPAAAGLVPTVATPVFVETKTIVATVAPPPAKPVVIPASDNGSHHGGQVDAPASFFDNPATATGTPANAGDDQSTVIDPYDVDDDASDPGSRSPRNAPDSTTDRPQG